MSSGETAIPDAIQVVAEWLKEWDWEEGDTKAHWKDYASDARDLIDRILPALRRHIADEIEAVAPDAVQVPTTLNHLTQQAERSGYFAAARVVRDEGNG